MQGEDWRHVGLEEWFAEVWHDPDALNKRGFFRQGPLACRLDDDPWSDQVPLLLEVRSDPEHYDEFLLSPPAWLLQLQGVLAIILAGNRCNAKLVMLHPSADGVGLWGFLLIFEAQSDASLVWGHCVLPLVEGESGHPFSGNTEVFLRDGSMAVVEHTGAREGCFGHFLGHPVMIKAYFR